MKPTISEHFADNGEHSHWSVIDSDTGECLIANIVDCAQQAHSPDAQSVAGCEDCGRVDGSHHTDCFGYKPRR